MYMISIYIASSFTVKEFATANVLLVNVHFYSNRELRAGMDLGFSEPRWAIHKPPGI